MTSLIVLLDAKKTDQERAEEVDAEILAAIATRKKLASDLELAKGIVYCVDSQTKFFSLT
jgi:ATP-dependent RNA helicase DDX41